MKLIIYTQYSENYGAHDWDGHGECPQYWKMKGGYDYVIKNFSGDPKFAIEVIRPSIETDTEYCHEYVLSYEVVEDSFKTEDELMGEEYGYPCAPTDLTEIYLNTF